MSITYVDTIDMFFFNSSVCQGHKNLTNFIAKISHVWLSATVVRSEWCQIEMNKMYAFNVSCNTDTLSGIN